MIAFLPHHKPARSRPADETALVPLVAEEGIVPKEMGEGEFPPKSAWGDGPWQDENVDMTLFASGHFDTAGNSITCFVMRNQMGAWCGYAQVPPEHPWRSLDDVEGVSVHGGVSFFEETDMGGEVQRAKWIGFDCGHCDDYQPAMETVMRKLIKGHRALSSQVYRTFEYVVEEARNLAGEVAAAMRVSG